MRSKKIKLTAFILALTFIVNLLPAVVSANQEGNKPIKEENQSEVQSENQSENQSEKSEEGLIYNHTGQHYFNVEDPTGKQDKNKKDPVDLDKATTDKLKELDSISILAEFTQKGSGVNSIFSVSNKDENAKHFHLYSNGKTYGYEIRGTGRSKDISSTRHVLKEKQANRIAFVASKTDGTIKVFVNGKLINTENLKNNDYKFIKDITGANTATVGATRRSGGANQYKFAGNIAELKVYSRVLTNEEAIEYTKKEAKEINWNKFENKLDELTKLIETIEPKDFTKASVTALAEALQKAIEVIINPESTDKQKEEALDKGFKAYADLVSIKELKDKLAEAEAIDVKELVDDSKTKLESLKTELKNLIAKEDATKEEIKTLVDKATEELKSLVYKIKLIYTLTGQHYFNIEDPTEEQDKNLKNPIDLDKATTDKIAELDSISIVAEFTQKDTQVGSLISLSKKAENNTHFHLYARGDTYGYELRGSTRTKGDIKSSRKALKAGEANRIALVASKETESIKVFVNGKLINTENLKGHEYKFIKDIVGLDVATVGATKRQNANKYIFKGNIAELKVYSGVLSDEEAIEYTSQKATEINWDKYVNRLEKLTKLIEAIVPEDYTIGSRKALKEAVEEAATIVTGADSTNEQKETAVAKANKAYEDLVSIKELKAKQTEANAIKADELKEKSKTALTDLKNELNTLLAKEDATKEEVTALVNKATEVLQSLRYIQKPIYNHEGQKYFYIDGPENPLGKKVNNPVDLDDAKTNELKNLESATIVAEFTQKNLYGHTSIGSLFSIADKNTAANHFQLYVNGSRLGYELRGTAQGKNEHGYADKVKAGQVNRIALVASKENHSIKLFLNGKLVNTKEFTPEKYEFIKNISGLNVATIGATRRSGNNNQYLFSGNIAELKVYSGAFTDEEAIEYTAKEATPVKWIQKENIEDPFAGIPSGFRRIPGLIRLQDGNLFASIDQRWGSSADSPENIDSLVATYDVTTGKWKDYNFPIHFGDYLDGHGARASASSIDPSIVQLENGDILLISDVFPGGIGSPNARVGSGMVTVDGKKYIALTDGDYANFSSFKYYIGDDKKVYKIEDKSETAYSVDGWYNLYKNGEALMVYPKFADGTEDTTKEKIKMNIFFANSELKPFASTLQWIVRSKDNGKTWEEPIPINHLKHEDEKYLIVGPGKGHVIKNGPHKGRILFPHYSRSNSHGEMVSMIYSDDNGYTWKRGNNIALDKNENPRKGSESQMIEFPDGSIRLFARTETRYIGYADSKDGVNFDTLKNDKDLYYGFNCLISVNNYDFAKINNKDAVVISYPYGKLADGDHGSRSNGKVRVGFIEKEGDKWTIKWNKHLMSVPTVPYSHTTFQYSAVQTMKDGRVALFYEGEPVNNMPVFSIFEIKDVLGKDLLDRTELDKLVQQIKDIDKSKLSEKKIAEIDKYLEEYKHSIFTEKEILDKEINKAKRVLRSEFENRMEDLAKLIQEIDENDYTQASTEKLTEALAKLAEVIAKPTATDKEKTDALDNAYKSYEDLVSIVALREKLAEAEAVEFRKLVDNSKDSLTKLKKELNDLLAKKDATKEEVKALVAKAEEVIEALEYIVPANKELLEKVVKTAKNLDTSKNTKENVDKHNALVTKAEGIIADDIVSQEEVDKAVNELLESINKLQKEASLKDERNQANRATAKVSIDLAEEIDLDIYTEESASELRAALLEAKLLLEKNNITDAEVEAIADRISKAIANLEVRKSGDVTPETPKVYETKSGYLKESISGLQIGEFVTGKVVDNKLEVTVNGETKSIPLRLLSDKPILVRGYAKFVQNIRNDEEKVVGILPLNAKVYGRLVGDRVYINYEGIEGKVYKQNLSDEAIQIKGYTKTALRMRDENGKVVGILPRGTYVEGRPTDSKILVSYAGNTGYIHTSYIQKDPLKASGYAKFTQNIRNEKGEIVGVLPMGEYISGEVAGVKVRIEYKGIKGFVYQVNLSKNAIKVSGKAKFTQNIRDEKGEIVGILPKNAEVIGTIKGNKLEINYRGVTGLVWRVNLHTVR